VSTETEQTADVAATVERVLAEHVPDVHVGRMCACGYLPPTGDTVGLIRAHVAVKVAEALTDCTDAVVERRERTSYADVLTEWVAVDE
jgi:hypothetical protein